MAYYYVNKNAQTNGDHEVHKSGCGHAPESVNQVSLGYHDDCKTAVNKSREDHYPKSNGCFYCCTDCHTG